MTDSAFKLFMVLMGFLAGVGFAEILSTLLAL